MNPVKSRRISVLIIEDNPDDAILYEEFLSNVPAVKFEIEIITRLSIALERLPQGGLDIILLDLNLPDSFGFNTFAHVYSVSADIPIIVLSALEDEETALKTVQEGAQDYLSKTEIDKNILARAIRYAIERNGLMSELREMSLIDEMTGVYNRRGFETLAQQHLRTARRTRKK